MQTKRSVRQTNKCYLSGDERKKNIKRSTTIKTEKKKIKKNSFIPMHHRLDKKNIIARQTKKTPPLQKRKQGIIIKTIHTAHNKQINYNR